MSDMLAYIYIYMRRHCDYMLNSMDLVSFLFNKLAFLLTEGCVDICEDEKQLMYTWCSYVYPSGSRCSNPIPRHLDPPLCGGHCDNVEPPKLEEDTANASTSDSNGGTGRDHSGSLGAVGQVATTDSDRRTSQTLVSDHEMCT